MFENVENLKIKSVLNNVPERTHGRINKRKSHSFIIRVKGSREYCFEDRTILQNEGEMIFLPKGCVYDYKNATDEEVFGIVINMEGDFGDVEPKVYSLKDFYEANYLMHHLADLWKLGDQTEKYKCMSLLYDLLSYVSNLENLLYKDKKRFFVIEPAVNYLKKHLYDCSLKIDELHKLCGISSTYFRKIFIAKFGTSPKNYITEKRVLQAKSIIDSGDFCTVKELALSVGYKDPLYFSKVFKKHYGISPTSMNK
ncbi:MAG: helix-turn-helix transcriptional regulator [Clostridia bacterium]|nr:helix-turn-helix transcriptional regulator [Clostridia bacterium]